MTNIIVSFVILAIVAASISKIVIEKKKGAKCIGCPSGKSSSSNCNCGH